MAYFQIMYFRIFLNLILIVCQSSMRELYIEDPEMPSHSLFGTQVSFVPSCSSIIPITPVTFHQIKYFPLHLNKDHEVFSYKNLIIIDFLTKISFLRVQNLVFTRRCGSYLLI